MYLFMYYSSPLGVFNNGLCPNWHYAGKDDPDCGRLPWLFNVEAAHYESKIMIMIKMIVYCVIMLSYTLGAFSKPKKLYFNAILILFTYNTPETYQNCVENEAFLVYNTHPLQIMKWQQLKIRILIIIYNR
jgi:hypothetical protein